MNIGDIIIVTTGQWAQVKGEMLQFVNSLGEVPIFIVKLSNGIKAYGTHQDIKVLQRCLKCPQCGYITDYRKRGKRSTKCPQCSKVVYFEVVDVDDDGVEVYQRGDAWKSR